MRMRLFESNPLRLFGRLPDEMRRAWVNLDLVGLPPANT